ncbi:MAG TPA: hypothetical protein VJS92_14970, partial [Candidatus Polarisedimenticolaceae bacterium]|nr:hypothetical protein [Candidatus Polarisedimenticolaceae bacterium]
MPETERVAAAATAKGHSVSSEALLGALQSLYRAYQKSSIYPPGHPAIPAALQQAAEQFASALPPDSPVCLGVGRDQLTLGGQPLSEATGALRSLAGLLHDLDLAALEFDAGVTPEELGRFLVALGDARREGQRGAAVVAALEREQLAHVRGVPVDYQLLNFEEGARDDAAAAPENVWDNLNAMLTEPTAEADAAPSPTVLAAEVEDVIRSHEGAGMGILRKRMQRLNRTASTLSPKQREATRKRMAEFVSALNPKLRRDLLRVDPAGAEESLALMTELADDLPDPDLLEALQEIDRTGGRLPDQLLSLFNKLMRLSHVRPVAATTLRDTLDNWGVPTLDVATEQQRLRAALEEVFQRRSRIDCIPQPHQDLLDNLSRRDQAEPPAAITSCYRDPRDPVDVRLHAAELAVRLLNQPGGDALRPGILQHAAGTTDLLLAHRKFEAVRDAAVAARTASLVKHESDVMRRLARGYLDEFKTPARLTRVLEEALKADVPPEAALSLLALGGSPAVDAVLDTLDTVLLPPARHALERFLVERGPEELRRAVEARAPRGWSALRSLFRVLRRLDPAHGLPILERLFRHPDVRVRRDALFALQETDRRSGAPEQHLARALGDKSRRLAAIALKRLTRLEGYAVIEVLANFLEGRLAGGLPPPELGRWAAASLLERDEVGIARLAAGLEHLSSGL